MHVHTHAHTQTHKRKYEIPFACDYSLAQKRGDQYVEYCMVSLRVQHAALPFLWSWKKGSSDWACGVALNFALRNDRGAT